MPHDISKMPEISEKIIDSLKNKEFPIPIIKIMKELGFAVGVQKLPDPLSGYIAVSKDVEKKFKKDGIICVNSKDSLGHQRFTIAHELAHFLFDYNIENKEYYNTYNTNDVENDVEKRANTFAANLLMPEKEFKQKYLDNWEIEALKKYFGVSERAIIKRVVELELE